MKSSRFLQASVLANCCFIVRALRPRRGQPRATSNNIWSTSCGKDACSAFHMRCNHQKVYKYTTLKRGILAIFPKYISWGAIMNKKGSEMSLNVIIIAAIGLLILLILAFLIVRSGSNVSSSTTKTCAVQGGMCSQTCDSDKTLTASDCTSASAPHCCKIV